MWRVAASSRHLRLYFAAHAALSHASPEARRELEDLLLQFRHAIPSPSATPAALALEHSLDQHQLREKVEGWVKACEHDAREFNEQAAQQLIPNLWISPLGPAESLEWLRAHGITHVIDATGGWRRRVSALENAWERVTSPMHAESGVQYRVVDAEDRPSFEIATFFEQTNAYIQEALATPQCAVLVHCHSGVSRSAAIVLAYLMSTFGITLREALRVVRDARPSVSPNAGFEKQLVRYEMSLKTVAARAESAQESKTGMKRVREDVKSAGSAERASAVDEPPSSQELLGLEVSEALSRLHAHMGSVPKACLRLSNRGAISLTPCICPTCLLTFSRIRDFPATRSRDNSQLLQHALSSQHMLPLGCVCLGSALLFTRHFLRRIPAQTPVLPLSLSDSINLSSNVLQCTTFSVLVRSRRLGAGGFTVE
ncbi:MAG: hypothetical protein SGPRY_010007 [Prymnesium sp.]